MIVAVEIVLAAAITVTSGGVKSTGSTIKFAVTAFAADMVTWQVVAVESTQAPPVHFSNNIPLFAVAVRLTTVFSSKSAARVEPEIPAGLLLTEPVPAPAFVTVSVNLGIGTKVAVTFLAAVIDIVQVVAVVAPHTSPDQPVNFIPASGISVKVTSVFKS